MKQYRVLVRRVMDGAILIDAEDEDAAGRAAQSMLERGSGEIDWCEPEDDIFEIELDEDE